MTRDRALRVILYAIAMLMVVAGLLMIVSSRSLIATLLLHPPEGEMSTLMLAALKEFGGIGIMVGVLLFFAAREPERNVAIIDGFIIGLVILTVTPLLSLATLDLQRLYPPSLIWIRALARLALAVVLYLLRPRASPQTKRR